MVDRVAEAIKRSEVPAAPAASVRVTLSTGRQAVLIVPHDMVGQEAIDLVGYIATQLPDVLEQGRRPASRLVVATGPVPRA